MQAFCKHKNRESTYLAVSRSFHIIQTLPKGSIIKSKMLILCGIPPHMFHLMLLFSYRFQNFSSKLVAIIPCCIYEIYGRYNLLLLLKTNNQMWLAGA